MERKCIFFVGAGMSIEAGLPSGKELASILYKELYPHDVTPDELSLPGISEVYVEKLGRNRLETKIRAAIVNRLDDADPKSYQLLAQLKPCPEIIITTNYDSLIQQSLGEANYTPIFEDVDAEKHTSANTNLYKIHGDIDYISKAIITETDIKMFQSNHPVLYQRILSFFTSKPVIFLGFSLQDKHIQSIYRECCAIQERMPPAYIVDPNDLDHLGEISPHIQHIKMPAYDFLEALLESLSEKCYNTMPLEGLHDPKMSIYNPFSIYSTEYFPENNWEDMLNNTFIPPMNFSLILEPGNTIIEGHRGSGKSMILKYLSFNAQIKRGFSNPWDKDNIGIYLKFKPSITSTTTSFFFKGDPSRGWITYFMTYVNLLLAEEILSVVRTGMLHDIFSIDEVSFVKEIRGLFFPGNHESNFGDNSINDLISTCKRTRNKLASVHENYHDLPPDFLEQLIEAIKSYGNGLDGKNFFILLDEYDNFDDQQKQVVNTLIKNRSFSYKIGVKLFEMTYSDISGKKLEKNNDYTYVNTDRFDQAGDGDAYLQYEKFIRDIANRRLVSYGYKNNIEELFPCQKDEQKKGFEHDDYSGFENIVNLSSCIVRDFLELCKDMVYYSNPWIINGEKREKIDPVSPNLQNTIIKIHSNIHYDLIKQIPGVDLTSKKPKSENVRLLVDNFAIIFQRILMGSTQKDEFRTVSGFQIKDVSRLKSTAQNALTEACSHRLLQVPLNPRHPQAPSEYVLGDRYRFHKLLCPRFRLSLSERWPKEIHSEVLNELFEDPDRVVNDVTKYFLKNIPLSYRELRLTLSSIKDLHFRSVTAEPFPS